LVLAEDRNDLFRTITTDDFNVKSTLAFREDRLDDQTINFLKDVKSVMNNTNRPNITWDKISPTKYVIHAESISPFFVSLVESFDPLWKAKIDGELIDEKFHISSHINSWYIDKEGVFDIILEYKSQEYFVIGYTISLVTLIGFGMFYIMQNVKLQRFFHLRNFKTIWRIGDTKIE